MSAKYRAGEGIRTLDVHLGKVALGQTGPANKPYAVPAPGPCCRLLDHYGPITVEAAVETAVAP